ncbi:MAG TPA: chemotaxis protein CheB, partial [Bdellovibrionales bacterium]|nr:chemotaxis protein CheB [Bdellovibrionales bacterium]
MGVGASAGGLEALRTLVTNLKGLKHSSVIIAQHLSPQHRSMLVDLIGRETPLRVKEVESGESPAPDTIYITPPNTDVFLQHDRLTLRKPSSKVGPKPSIDLFFRSLAEGAGERAIGIILSGTGTDGSEGIKAIKGAGGMTMAQEPETAKYDGMPLAAVHTGMIDVLGGPEQLADALNRLGPLSDGFASTLKGSKSNDPYAMILSKIKAETNIDFMQYKPNTVRRRLQRRMVANRIETLEKYLEFLDRHPQEIQTLFQDIVISVTSFFRDPAAFKDLEKQIRRALKGNGYKDNCFRVWVPGCATGEEAYTIAMLLCENRDVAPSSLKIQVFATDVSEPALATARRGCYPEAALANVPPKFLQKYFTKVDKAFQVKKGIRDMVVFARQNLLTDPPFLKLDLISCRNVFIYFNQEAQDKVFKTFH